MRTRIPRASLALAACLLAPGAALAQVEYDFTLVDAFAADYGLRETYLWDINDSGVACGVTTITTNGFTGYTGFTWTPAARTPIPVSWARGISNPGLVVGVAAAHDLATGQTTTSFPLLPGTYYAPSFSGVNDAGLAVGSISTCTCSDSGGILRIPYLWIEATGARTINVPGANGVSRINNAGQLIGWSGGNTRPSSFYYDLATEQHTVMSSVFVNPPNLTPWTTAEDISETGVVVGLRRSDDGLITYGYTWRPGEAPQLLPLPPAGYQPYVRPAAINAAATIVGSIALPSGSSRAFVYDAASGVRDLNTLAVPSPGFVMLNATGINEHGWIVGFGAGGGGVSKAFVLRPLTPGCAVDWDHSGGVTSSDISAFLTSWLASVQGGTLAADFNNDMMVNSNDISAYLSAWLLAVQNGC